jgi:hypothetical protein
MLKAHCDILLPPSSKQVYRCLVCGGRCCGKPRVSYQAVATEKRRGITLVGVAVSFATLSDIFIIHA